MSYQVLCSLRIYLRRGDLAETAGFWRRLFRKPVAAHLVNEALRAGITHASLTYGNMGFARGSKVVAADVSEIPFDTLPVCVELIAPRPLLDRFVQDQAKHLRDATLVMHEGVQLRAGVDDATGGDGGVEYVRVGEPAESTRMLEPAKSVVEAKGSVTEES